MLTFLLRAVSTMKPRHRHVKFQGSISLWRYTENERNYPGWHLSADARGTASLLSVLSELRSSAGDCTIPITAPTESVLSVPNNKGSKAAWIAPEKWRIRYLDGVQDATSWRFSMEANTAVFSLGREGLLQLVAGVEGIVQGRGDCTIGRTGPADEVLWFWWRIA